MSGLFGVPSGTGAGSVPWYQQPTYTGQGLIPSSALFGGIGSGAKPGPSGGPDGAAGGGGSAPGQKQNQQKAEAPAEEDFYCDSCEKEFSQESQYKAHIATHVSCLEPGCKFTGSQRVVKEHAQMAHGSGKKKGGDGGLSDFGISLETPEEIARWREARAKNWPSNANIQRKKEMESQRQSRGQPNAPQQKKGRQGGPAWKMKSSIQANGGGGSNSNAKQARNQGQNHEREEDPRGRGSHGNAAQDKQDADDAGARGAEESKEKSDAAAAPAPASDIFGLGCYESDEEEVEEEDEGPPVAAATRQSAEDVAREQYLQEEKEQHERQQAAAQHGGRGHGGSKVSERGGGARGGSGNSSSSSRNAARGDGNSRKKGRGSDGYQSHGKIERRGGSLLGKLLSDDTHKQDAMLLQAIRHLTLEFPPPE